MSMRGKPLRIVADAHVFGAEQAFARIPGHAIELRLLETAGITPEALARADVLITRSSLRVDAALLAGSRVRFVATATIGHDHLDTRWLEAQGIVWADAAGSSTGSVVEYMLALLLELHGQRRIALPGLRLGIIGAGRIGGELARIARALGIHVLLNDPPRARNEGAAGFLPLSALLEEADVLSLHTPLIRHGEDATFHLLDAARLARFRGKGIINAARGGCVDNRALAAWLDADADRWAALDCWEHEPAPDPALIRHPRMAIATPHIAGHSLDGKAANTLFACRALCRWLGVPCVWSPDALLPAPSPVAIESADEPWETLRRAAGALYPIRRDHAAMRAWGGLPPPEIARRFRDFRRHYPPRRSWARTPLRIEGANDATRRLARACGFRLA